MAQRPGGDGRPCLWLAVNGAIPDVLTSRERNIAEPVRQRWDFFFNVTATTEIYPLSLHDALPISSSRAIRSFIGGCVENNFAIMSPARNGLRSEEHTSELQSHVKIVCRLLVE